VPNVAGGADEFAQGKADVFNFALGAGKVAETDAKVGGIRALNIDPSPGAMARLRKWVPVAYAAKVEPGKGRAGINETTTLFGYDYLVLASTKVSDDAVYKLTKILVGFMPGRMNKDMAPVQFHAGAIKFYKEIGAWPPKSGS
jgi:TRAP-type uncharacterized transport system substrate-binding protein